MGKLIEIGSKFAFFHFSPLKNTFALDKNGECYFVLPYKNRNISQFNVFTIKNLPESGKFRFENSLK